MRAWICGLAVCLPAAAPAAAQEKRLPNIVFILTDNQGPWTLGCYGNKDIKTPNIDRLASKGTRFTRAFSSNAVCSPSRATLLTGLIPSQHGIHCYLRGNEYQVGPNAQCTIVEFATLYQILGRAGYVCGLAGKWHLGANAVPQAGFTTWVTMPAGHTAAFYNADVIENGKTRKESAYLTDLWTDRAVAFIEQNKDRPFFLYVAYNGPYGLGKTMLEPARNRHAAYYADKQLPSFPREKMNPWLFEEKANLNNIKAIRRYAAEVSGVDDGVGRIMATLAKHRLDDNTLVVFTADQGLAGGQGGFWGMGDHTRPLTLYDAMLHVPLIYRQPGRIPAGKTADLLNSNYDFLPTMLDYLDMKERTPNQPPLPGRSFAATLRGQTQTWSDVVFMEFENVRRPYQRLEVHRTLSQGAERAVPPEGRSGRAPQSHRSGGACGAATRTARQADRVLQPLCRSEVRSMDGRKVEGEAAGGVSGNATRRDYANSNADFRQSLSFCFRVSDK